MLNYAVRSFLENVHFESLLATAGCFKQVFHTSGGSSIPRSQGRVNQDRVKRGWASLAVLSSQPFAIGKQGSPRCTLNRVCMDSRQLS